MSVTAASVPTTGEKVNLTFSGSVGSVDSALFPVVANGVPIELAAATGAGTAWALPLTTRSGWVPSGQTVKVTDVAGSNIVSATNSGTVTQAQRRYVERGFGIFVHLSSSTWYTSDPISHAQVNAIDMPSYDMEQWFTTVIVPSGARYAVFTTKHAGGYSWWPTSGANFNITQTAFATAHPGADLLRDWVRLCRKYNIGVGFYLNFYDSWWTHVRPGYDGTYNDPAYVPYMTNQITELFSNYGKIDMLWVDSLGYSISYTIYPWSTIQTLRDSLQPSCVLVGNAHDPAGFALNHSDIGVFEGSGGPGLIPVSTNTVPSEFSEDAQTNDLWVWSSGSETYKDVYAVAGKVAQCKTARCAYLLNFPPNQSGLMPTATGTYIATLGGIIGKQGANPVEPSINDVRAGIDRGDGQVGAWGGGINSSAILGLS